MRGGVHTARSGRRPNRWSRRRRGARPGGGGAGVRRAPGGPRGGCGASARLRAQRRDGIAGARRGLRFGWVWRGRGG
eukprot:4409955-Prymnesium_polylepis.1